jgi:hypothetical protein
MPRDFVKQYQEISETVDAWSESVRQAEAASWGDRTSAWPYIAGYLQSMIKGMLQDLPRGQRERYLAQFRDGTAEAQRNLTWHQLKKPADQTV